MATMIIDPLLEAGLKAQRRATGADRYDEVWEGVYMMAPMPNTEHQQIVSRLVSIFEQIAGWPGLGVVVPGVNLSDREQGWQQDYRVPDVAVALAGGSVRDLDTHWVGGPDFIVEVVSPEDQTREKLAFYSRIEVRELLLVDRRPWLLELFHFRDGSLTSAGKSTIDQQNILASTVLPLTFRLVPGEVRPLIEVVGTKSDHGWQV